MTRRSLRLLAAALVLAASAPALVPAARAELVIDVKRGNFQPIPIAIADFAGEGDLGQRVSGIVINNLSRSGYFVPVEKSRFPERPAFDAPPNFEAWKGTGAQGLVTGRVTRDASGRLKAEFRLWDLVAGQQYFT
ncbi:MAG TPA: Tol-Pal system protein TolB, partial [Enterovirga sp.]